ncbi:Berberine bridge enzyme-like D-2 [Linum grandiflorum]
MANSLLPNNYPLLLLLLVFTSFLLHFPHPTTSLATRTPRTDVQIVIASCFHQNQIQNFTTPTSNPTTFYTLLRYSIQNLRFDLPKPLAIVLPSTVEELIGTVSCCRGHNVAVKVRCGGHSYEGTSFSAAPNNSNDDDFVIVDLMRLNGVSVDLETETAWVEGGATLGETYWAIAEASDNGYAFSAGSCPTVGVGGHIGGGGYGLLSRRYGVAADNVVDALLVDANGVLQDRKSMGEDVFWAIRGGGGGTWGIIYAWKINLLKIAPKLTAFTVSRQPSSKSNLSALLAKWQTVAPNLDPDLYLSCFVGSSLPQAANPNQISATFKGLYLGPKETALSTLNRAFPELAIGAADCYEMSWIESVLFFSGLDPVKSSVLDLKDRYFEDKHCFKAKSDYVRNEIPAEGIERMVEMLEKEPKGYVILDPYGGKMSEIRSDAIAFPHREGNLFTIQYLVEWRQEESGSNNSTRYVEWIREFYEAMTNFVSKAPRAAYVNYMDFDLGENGGAGDQVEVARVWGDKYFLGNFERLVMAKTLIDPHNVFNNQQSIPPLSSFTMELRDDV